MQTTRLQTRRASTPLSLFDPRILLPCAFSTRYSFFKHLGVLHTESGQTLQSSFSAVSKPAFASKYSCEHSRRDLHNALLCTVLFKFRPSLVYLSVLLFFLCVQR